MLTIDSEVRVGLTDDYVTQISRWEGHQRTEVVSILRRSLHDDCDEAVDAAARLFFAARDRGISDDRILNAFRMFAEED